MNINDVDAANRMLDQETDFRLDDIEPKEEERTERQEEYSQICDYLTLLDLPVMDIVKVSAKLMDSWTEINSAYYYEVGTHITTLFYRNFEITKQDNQWMLEWQEDGTQRFFHANLLAGLKVIDGLYKNGEVS